ncbi:HigA family addiction module antitoxin [Breoghania sp. L-A4]|uniref:HigA family addiction module antitoxin n=1 Tax=Breoghania sp. L-A4 TaxID=2304600 RepID=UPI000E359EAA|nr:HigA family addiction module antitoxin [Breoghania sp. L-A4]AXS42072.1 addiction module antidote protein, HigA family [Breoghania sp. L-A4]
MSDDRFAPIHPGEILREEYLPEFGLTAYGLAKALHVPRDRIEALVRERRGITADTALRLGRFFGQTPDFWLNLQTQYDLEVARLKLGADLEGIAPLRVA